MAVDVMRRGNRHGLRAAGKRLVGLWHSELHIVIIHFTADRGDLRLRLDQILVRHVTGVSKMSRTRAQSWIADGMVNVDGVAAPRASVKVREGAAIEVALPGDTPLRET